MKKRAAVCLLALVMVFMPFGFSGLTHASFWADEMMENLVLKEILKAIPEEPDRAATREEFCVMLAKAALLRAREDLPEPDLGAGPVFADMDEIPEESLPYILYLYHNNLLYGSLEGGSVFMLPGEPITRQDTAVFIGRWLGVNPSQRSVSDFRFTDDNELADYAFNMVYQLTAVRIISGYPDLSFRPENNISLAEVSALLHISLDRKILLTAFGEGSMGNADGDGLSARFALPSGFCLDGGGSLLVFDTFNASVKQLKDGLSLTVLGFSDTADEYGFAMPYYLDGGRETALFGRPSGGVSAENGDLFIVDTENHAIRLLRDDTVFTFAGGARGFADGRYGGAMFDSPSAIAMGPNGNLYVADTMNDRVRMIDPDGNVTTVAVGFNEPFGIAVGADGTVYVADTGNHVIKKIKDGIVSIAAGVLGEPEEDEDYAEGGYEDGDALDALFFFPTGLHFAGGILFIADTGNHTVRALTADGRVVTVAGSGEPGDADGPPGVAMMNKPSAVFYTDGFLYIADTLNNKIKAVSLDLKEGF
jgi:hypothetical protein